MLHVDRAIVKYLDLMPAGAIADIRFDAVDLLHDDAKKVLPKIGGRRPGKKCKGSYISADKKCGDHTTQSASGKRKLSESGKKSAMELAAKVRERKGLGSKSAPKKALPQPPKMPKLNGSEKQVDWANRIREVSLGKFDDHIAEIVAKSGDKKEPFAQALKVLYTEIASEKKEARWWIDNRAVGGSFGQKSYNMVSPFRFKSIAKQGKQERWGELIKEFDL